MGQHTINAISAALFAIVANILVGRIDFPTDIVSDDVTVDFIVVGSGASGSPVAGRLSEIPEWDVLVLEAGGKPPPESRIPGFSINFIPHNNRYSYNYRTTPQKYSQLNYKNHTNQFPRGKVIGGSSAINFMMYNRGNRYDFDRWAELGNPGWDYQTVLKYFKKSENYRGHLTSENEAYHGIGGPLNVESKRWGTPVMKAYLEAGRELGYPTIDPNAASQIGFNTPDTTTKNGERGSAAEAFIKPNLHRQNLRIQADSQVTKVKRAYVRKEVILSAGAIDSPKLLMLSGIGPKQHLESVGIRTLVDLPGVGQNFQDHPSIYGISWTVPKGMASSYQRLLSPWSKLQYITNRRGPLSAPMGVEGNAWAQLGDGQDPTFPDVQFLIVSLSLAIDYGLVLSPAVGFKREVYEDYFQPDQGREGFNIGPMLTVPKSRGSITLRSSDPADPPLIDPNFLSHPDDVELFVKGIKFALAIGNTTAMRNGIGATFNDRPVTGCKHLLYGSDDYWRCFTHRMVSTTCHPTSTCMMAPDSDPNGVVSSRLLVRGVTGLRVIDASIMPLITSALVVILHQGHTSAARPHEAPAVHCRVCSFPSLFGPPFDIVFAILTETAMVGDRDVLLGMHFREGVDGSAFMESNALRPSPTSSGLNYDPAAKICRATLADPLTLPAMPKLPLVLLGAPPQLRRCLRTLGLLREACISKA
ncbi:Glucose-methanol-choline oxidoreductase C-terminal [Trinorchestia longiramus]|nr:Glucose-methanol-choline oxidoreductase C-terminal [Trinorchestia longiramus]